VNLTFVKNKKEIFKATSWAGYVGIMTGMIVGEKISKYSVSLNYRRSDGTLLGNVQRAMALKWPIGYLIREVLECGYTYQHAKKVFKTYQLISPCYVTMCNQDGASCIIVRNPDSCVKLINSRKHVCQTNIDPDCNDPYKNIMYSIERRGLVNNIISNDSSKWKSYSDVVESFSQYPIINDITIYCVLMDPKNGLYLSFIP